MLGGGDEHAFLHQTGGIADLGNIATDGFDFEAIKVGAAEHNAGAGGRRKNSEVDRGAAVETHAAALDRIADCTFVDQIKRTKSSAYNRLQG